MRFTPLIQSHVDPVSAAVVERITILIPVYVVSEILSGSFVLLQSSPYPRNHVGCLSQNSSEWVVA